MRTTKIYFILSISGFLCATSAFAGHYGAAGCGLGSSFIQDNGIISQVAASTTNGTSANQTFGITSGTSNCTDHGTVAKNLEYPSFVEVNRLVLANDIARGNGEALATLSNILGCSNRSMVGSKLQQNYNVIFNKQNIENHKLGDAIRNTLKSDAAVAKGCSQLG